MDMATAFFQSAGYRRVPAVWTAEECQVLVSVGEEVARSSGSVDVTADQRRTRVDQAVSRHEAILAAATDERLVSALVPVLGPNIELVENRHNHLSTYRCPSGDRLHRDVLQWSRSILTVLVYLSDCTDPAAATRVLPGSHLWPCTGAPNNGGTWLDESADFHGLGEQAAIVPANAGDVLLMHGQLYHAGAGASPAGARVVLTLAYRSVDELTALEPTHCRLVTGRRTYRGR